MLFFYRNVFIFFFGFGVNVITLNENSRVFFLRYDCHDAVTKSLERLRYLNKNQESFIISVKDNFTQMLGEKSPEILR